MAIFNSYVSLPEGIFWSKHHLENGAEMVGPVDIWRLIG